MTFAYGMIVVAMFLPYAAVVLAKSGGVDNHAPRATLAALTGWRQRADWAHRNHFEAFAPFAAAVIVAELAHVAQAKIDIAAGAFIALRIVYTGLYIADLATLRTIAWSLGFICVLALFVMSA
ncbi:MAG TPA: MAPEG family protein [Stellaceae bacterium]|nr:MAPEG family protein [Stellaceae bacterium]